MTQDFPLKSITFGSKAPQKLVFVLHGYGASAENIAPVAEYLGMSFKDAFFVIPQAPYDHPMIPGGAYWFEIGDLEPELLKEGVDQTIPILTDEIQAWQGHTGIAADHTVVIGFSQGAMLAMSLNHYGTVLAHNLVAFSGGLPMDVSRCAPDEKYLIIHGQEDQVVVPERSHQARDILIKAGCSVEYHILQGLDHSISPEGLTLATQFLTKNMGF